MLLSHLALLLTVSKHKIITAYLTQWVGPDILYSLVSISRGRTLLKPEGSFLHCLFPPEP